jgi:hypothetical protein
MGVHRERAPRISPVIECKEKLIEQDVYDALIEDWARKTGRPVR